MLVSLHQFMRQTCSGRDGKCSSCGIWSVHRVDYRSGQPRKPRSRIRTVLPASPVGKSLQQESCRRGRNQTLCSFFSLSRDTGICSEHIPQWAGAAARTVAARSGVPCFQVIRNALFQELSGGRVGSCCCAATILSTAALLDTRSEIRAPRCKNELAKIEGRKKKRCRRCKML